MALFSDILLTVDYDRTTTASDGTIPERNLEAIRYFMENGGAFTVNTGRSFPMAKAILDNVPLSAPLLLCNGSAAYDTASERFLFCHEIQLDPWETGQRCLSLFPDLIVDIQGISALYCLEENPYWEAYYARFNTPRKVFRPGEDIGPFVKFSVKGNFYETPGDGPFVATPEQSARMDQAAALMQEHFGAVCEIYRSAPRVLEIHAKGVSKARSARELQQRLGRKVLVCVGDAENDLTMLREADFAFCPSDGVIAAQFPNVCPCGEGAVADVIYKKIPEIIKKWLDKTGKLC